MLLAHLTNKEILKSKNISKSAKVTSYKVVSARDRLGLQLSLIYTPRSTIFLISLFPGMISDGDFRNQNKLSETLSLIKTLSSGALLSLLLIK